MFELTPNQRKLYTQLVVNEGKRSKKYVDTVGKDSIGIGRNLKDVGLRPHEIKYLWENDLIANPELASPPRDNTFIAAYVKHRVYTKGLAEDEIQYLWRSDVIDTETQLDKHLPWWRKLDLNRQRVMIDLCFNMGIHTLLDFKNTLANIKAGNYKAAARGMLSSKWAGQVDRIRGDNKGRADLLAKMMETGNDTYCR